MTPDARATLLDLRGLKCPLPALRTRRALEKMAPGALLVVECTDPMAAIDLPHCAAANGHTLEAQSVEGGVMRFRIRRRAQDDPQDNPPLPLRERGRG